MINVQSWCCGFLRIDAMSAPEAETNTAGKTGSSHNAVIVDRSAFCIEMLYLVRYSLRHCAELEGVIEWTTYIIKVM